MIGLLRRFLVWAKQVNWQTEPVVIMGVVKAVVAALAGVGFVVTDHQVAAIALYVTAFCMIAAAFITRRATTSQRTVDVRQQAHDYFMAAATDAIAGAHPDVQARARLCPGPPAGRPQPALMAQPYGQPQQIPDTSGDAVTNPAGDHPQYKLGRVVNHDPRSRDFPHPEAEAGTAFHAVRWARRVGVFDQGQVGSCTGNAAAGWVGTDDHTRDGLTATTSGPVDESLAVRIYATAEQIDGDGDVTVKQTGPETFTVDPDLGSSGLSVAKVLKTDGLCSGYTHAFSIQAAYTALQTGPVLAGTNWYQSMFTPAADGQIHVDKSSGLAGGHEYVLDELEVDGNGQPTKIWMQNSWGEGWGLGGRAYFTPAGLTSLLAANGDVTVPTAIVVAPTPPQPDPTPTPDGDASFLAAFDAAYPGTVAWATTRAAHRSKATGTPMTPGQYLRWLVAGEAGTRPHAGAGG